MRSHAFIAFSILTLGLTPLAEAHITQDYPAPRSTAQKQGPCGATDSPRGPAQVFAPGETITVEWTETVEHPGHYRIAFDVDGEDFPIPNNPDDNFEVTLVDQIADRNVNGGADRTYSQEVTFPDIECDNCTLQLIQVMTTNIPYNSFYFQCSDIILSANGGVGGADAGPGGGAEGADAGVAGGDGTGTGGGDGSGGGGGGGGGDPSAPTTGGCSSAGGAGFGMGLLLLGLFGVLRSSRVRVTRRHRSRS